MASPILVNESDHLRAQWGWLLAIGLALTALGIIALAFAPIATIGTVLVLGWLILISGVAESVCAFRVRRWGGMFLHLAGGVLGILLGLLIVTDPLAGALGLTMLLAAYLSVVGLFRTIAAAHLRYRLWGWAVLDGLVALALGLLLWAAWPIAALWFPGVAVGIALLLRGWTTIIFAVAVRRIEPEAGYRNPSL